MDSLTQLTLGAAVGEAIRWGVARGLFSNEAGLGSSPMAHAAARTNEPVREGLVAMMEPFIDTLVICTMTGHNGTLRGAIGLIVVTGATAVASQQLVELKADAASATTSLAGVSISDDLGARLLAALGIRPSVWHINEGHAAFMAVERVDGHAAGERDARGAGGAERSRARPSRPGRSRPAGPGTDPRLRTADERDLRQHAGHHLPD